eukprot:1162151-Pelagomonas_calceolata.AAC.19
MGGHIPATLGQPFYLAKSNFADCLTLPCDLHANNINIFLIKGHHSVSPTGQTHLYPAYVALLFFSYHEPPWTCAALCDVALRKISSSAPGTARSYLTKRSCTQ